MAYLFILTTLNCVVDLFASIIIRFITAWCYSESSKDQVIRRDLIALKREMSTISMVDEFSKYAKLQRKYNKLESEAKEKINLRTASRVKLRSSLIYGIRVINGIFTFILFFLYRREPVVIFPSGTLWPLENIFSWPSEINSCISLPMWITLMKLTVFSYNKLVL